MSESSVLWLRIPARLSPNADESGLCCVGSERSGKPLQQREHVPLGNGACGVRILAYSWIHAESFFSYRLYHSNTQHCGLFDLEKPWERLFVCICTCTDPQSLTKIQIALKTKRLFLSLKQKTSDSKILNGTDKRLVAVFILFAVNEIGCSRINVLDYGVLPQASLEVCKLCAIGSVLLS